MNNRKFLIDDYIRIKKDIYCDYGLCLGLYGKIMAYGMKHNGIFTYLAKINRATPVEIRVWEPDIERIINDN